jgi:ATP-dependent exoDNAse (exonuclease V) alpha subunit
VLIVDEAGMVGTRELATLIHLTRHAGVKLVLVGDPAQLPEIDAGGLFAGLAQRLPAVTLSGNLRQRETWERQALEVLRDGDALTAVDLYDAAGRLHLLDDASAARAEIVADYVTARSVGASVVMLSSRRVDARVLNALARNSLHARGELGDRRLVINRSGGVLEWRVGDEAVVTANHYPLGLINGSRGRVTRVDAAGITITVDGRALLVPKAQLEADAVDYGYAMTCHKAQGITVDVALVYASSALTREAGYVGMSRGRLSNHLYGTLEALLPEVDAGLDHPLDDPVPAEERTDLTRSAVVARLDVRARERLALSYGDGGLRRRVQSWLRVPAPDRAVGRGH